MQGRRNVKTFGRVQAWKAKPAPLIGIGVKLIYKDTVPVLMSSHVPVVLIYVSRYRGSVNKWLEINPSSMYLSFKIKKIMVWPSKLIFHLISTVHCNYVARKSKEKIESSIYSVCLRHKFANSLEKKYKDISLFEYLVCLHWQSNDLHAIHTIETIDTLYVLLVNTWYTTDSTLVSPVKIEYGWNL